MKALPRRYFNRWNLLGLVLLPALYWSVDLLWHASVSELRLFLLVNLAIPLLIGLAAFLCWTLWDAHLSECAGLASYTLLGIYFSGPTYMFLLARLFQGHVPSNSPEFLSGWALTTLFFPMSTFVISTYDATLPAPFLTCLCVWLAGRIHARSQSVALSKSV
jgi:hypothetical protein